MSAAIPDETLLIADFGIATIIPPGEKVVSGLPCGTKVRYGSVSPCNGRAFQSHGGKVNVVVRNATAY